MQPVNSDGLKWLVEKAVSINRGGPESKKGWLVTVKDDHLVLQTDEQYLYYQTKHVKSITVDSTEPLEATVPYDKKLVYWDAISFNDILEKMIFRRVQINQGGPESINGILSRLFENHVDLVQGHEVIKVATPHIKNVSYSLSNQDDNSNSKKGSQAEEMVNEMKEQTIVQETTPAEVEQKQLAQKRRRRRRRLEKKEIPAVQELKSINPVEMPAVQKLKSIDPVKIPLVQKLKSIDPVKIPLAQELKLIDPVKMPPVQELKSIDPVKMAPVQELKSIDPVIIHPDHASDSIKGDEFTDALPIMADDQNQVTTEQIVEAPSQERSFIHNPVSNNPEALFHFSVVKQTAKKAGALRSRKSKLLKRKRKAIRPTIPQRKRQMIKPKLLRVSRETKKIIKIKITKRVKATKRIKVTKRIKETKRIKVTKRWLFLSKKPQPSKAVVLGSVWLAPSIKMHLPR
ncbi:hypothetical protein GC093_33690 [Paenibacillus sp. LMG 31456]|uniref:Uncharacterized protein n=1 Tax=Paenibacillus foliorum TaxID=2654974 RepID=A0A972H2B1_9BACL|nr:hypothetical protein [Paenibacillus foliorum]NOU98147.1 hypothetical protein [Paenibacillus foliorum]